MGFFKAYDMRGTFGADFDLDLVYRVGRALPQVVPGRRWLVGRDCRTTSDAVRHALVSGLLDAGVEVTDLGRCTTPMVYFFTAEDDFDGSVMITASHNPSGDNGLKVSKKTALPVGYANGLNRVEALATADASVFDRTREPSVPSLPDALSRYVAWMKDRNPAYATLGEDLRLAVDCSNGMASLLAHELFPGAVFLNDAMDGTFPNHSPNPLNASAREQIAAAVREKGLDAGVIFDGDADRAMFVDETGAFVQPDYLIPLVADATLNAHPIPHNSNTQTLKTPKTSPSPTSNTQTLKHSNTSPKIIHDVRTSRGAIETLLEAGCEPVMVPVGHAFAKPILREIGAVCGGELAGHYYFAEFFGCDSGVLAALRILAEVARAKREKGLSFSALMAPIISRYANSGELNFKVEDKEAAIARVLETAAAELPPETGRETMDGIRIEYAEGWINVRKSNTEPYLRLLVEADAPERLADWKNRLTRAIEGSER